jgi:hypothetical protein
VATETFLGSLLKKLRASLLAKVGVGADEIAAIDKNNLINLIELLEEASESTTESLIEELPLEIAVIKWCGEGGKDDHLQSTRLEINSPVASGNNGRDGFRSETSAVRDLAQTEISGTHGLSNDLKSGNEDHDSAQTVTPVVHKQPTVDTTMGEGVNDDVWKNILSLVKPVNASVEALLRSSKPIAYDGKVLTLGVYYKFHKERLEDVSHRRVLEDIVAKVLGSPTRVTCVLVDPPPRKVIEETKVEAVLTEGKDRDIIKAAEEIFGN